METFKENDMMYSSEALPNEIQEFCDNVPGADIDGLYLCQSIDMDGNVVDTKIGRNLMTNYGLRLIYNYTGNKWDSEYRIYTGSGKTEPEHSGSSLTQYISALDYATSSWNSLVQYPARYDKQTHLFSSRCKIYQGYWDYTAGNNQEYEIWEIGLGYGNVNNIVTHALIYDKNGNQSCIIKKPNTRLFITVYWVGSINTRRIQEAYDKGQYALIAPLECVNKLNPVYKYRSCLVRDYLYNSDRSSIYHQISDIRNIYGSVTESGNVVDSGDCCGGISYLWEYTDLYTCGFMFANNRKYISAQTELWNLENFSILTYDELPEDAPESMSHLESEDVYINYLGLTPTGIVSTSSQLLSDVFGAFRYKDSEWQHPDGILPCTQFDIESLMMYNHLTKEWDIPVEHTNAPDTYYNWTHWRSYMPLWINYGGSSRTVYVHVNPYTQWAIKSFSNSAMSICATDEYWDTDTWELIPNLGNVPEELQRKRYYIVVAGTNAVLSPVYDSNERIIHKINLDDNRRPYEITNGYVPVRTYDRCHREPRAGNSSPSNIGSTPISSDKYGYILSDMDLIYIDDNKNCVHYDMLFANDTLGCAYRRWVTNDEDKIIMFMTYYSSYNTSGNRRTNGYRAMKNNLRIFTVGDRNTEPVPIDVTLTFSSTIPDDLSNVHHYTWSENGFLVSQRRESVNEAVVLDVYGTDDIPEQYIISDCKHCAAIKLTDYCVYQDMNEQDSYVFRIYNMKTREVYESFEINDGTPYSINGIYGWREFVYVNVTKDSVNYTFFYNMETKMMEQLSWCHTGFNTNASWYTACDVVAIDECMVICSYGSDSNSTWIYKASDPISPISTLVNTQGTGAYLNYSQKPQIKRINDGKQLILVLMNYYYPRVYDLGWILDHGKLPRYPYYHFRQISYAVNDRNGTMYIFNDGVAVLDGYKNGGYAGHIYWAPIECWLRMKITGKTKTINAYNNPIRFWGKTYQLKWTNDYDRLVDDQDKPPTSTNDDNEDVTTDEG